MRNLTLEPENEIELMTMNGPCKIQLLSGDITTLPVEEKVDIIMVSAFPGDYAPVRSTVIGALKNNLGISVRDLAFDKQLDLRTHFSCWMSTITTNNSPFKKLLCFERQNYMSVVEQVSQMFSVFVPVFNNQDNTVITPLLAAGNQGQSELKICETMVKAGAHWINAGLSLRCLKIVIYRECSQEITAMFQNLKKKLLAKNLKLRNQITKKSYDVFVSFHPNDESKYVKSIVDKLKKERSDIKLCASVMEYDHNAVWQRNIFNAMVSSKRIIVVLTTLFLESVECLEQYNMARCCCKLMGGDILAPFYMESINSLPAYMTLVQWIDCRERKEGDKTLTKIHGACSKVLTMLDQPLSTGNLLSDTAIQADSDKFQFDVFISYSHKNPKEAETLLNIFKEVDDSVRVFYDRNALTTGSNWQEVLYQCMGQCKCAIALLSPTYLTSTVCMEEYNLALARFLSQDKGMQFLPIWIDKSDTVPIQVSGVTILDAVERYNEKAHDIAKYISNWLKNSENPTDTSLFPPVSPEYRQDTEGVEEEDTVMETLLSTQRSSNITTQYRLKMKKTSKEGLERVTPLAISDIGQISGPDATDIVVSFSNDSSYLVNIFCVMLYQKYEHLKINRTMDQSMERMEALNNANVLVVFISTEFLRTDSHMHELYLALTRQRSSDKKILYLIKTTAFTEASLFFPRILCYDLASSDPVWRSFETDFLKGKYHEDYRKMVIKSTKDVPGQANFHTIRPSGYFAMTKASDDVIALVLNLSDRTVQYTPMLLNLVAVEMEVTGKVNQLKLNENSEMTGSSHTAPKSGATVIQNEQQKQGTEPSSDKAPSKDLTPNNPNSDRAPNSEEDSTNTNKNTNNSRTEDETHQERPGSSAIKHESKPHENEDGVTVHKASSTNMNKTKTETDESRNENHHGKTEGKKGSVGVQKGTSKSCHLL